MKKLLLLVTVISLIIHSGCKKADTTPPVITLKGDNPFNLTINSEYNDPGYTATDNKDGDITSKVTSSWKPAFNKDLTGKYICTYVVSDAAGNKDTARRTVNVINSAGFLFGDYLNASGSCAITGPLSFDSRITVSSTTNNTLTIGNFGGFGVTLNAFYFPSGDSVSIPTGQSLSGTKSLVSSAVSISNHTNPTVLNINFTWTDGHNSDNCSSTYTK